MKRITLTFILCLSALIGFAQSPKAFMLTGASFGVKENGWFEIGCEAFNVEAINKAVSAESIKDIAKRMYNKTAYTTVELNKTDAFVIMHVHNEDVADTERLKDDYTEYTLDEVSNYYACAYDYVIKRYKADCKALKDEPTSDYYGTEEGKPATIILCTHWHDARTAYNASIRILAEKWGLPLVKWDDNIGFTKDVLEDGKQPSLKYAKDTQVTNGVTYGWHPKHGKHEYIQNKMAWIFIDEMSKLFGEIPVTASLQTNNMVILPGENPSINFSFTGIGPWNITYDIDGVETTVNNINTNLLKVNVDMTGKTSAKVKPVSVSTAVEENGTVVGETTINYQLRSFAPKFDTYAHEYNKNTAYPSAELIELKKASDGWSREAFVSFDLTQLSSDDEIVTLRLFFDDLVYSLTTPPVENHLIGVSGNTKSYTTFNWNTKPTDFTKISGTWVTPDEKGTYLNFDITDWAKEQAANGATTATIQLQVLNMSSGLFRFPSLESTTSTNKPVIVTAKNSLNVGTNLPEVKDVVFEITNNYIKVNTATQTKINVSSVTGLSLYNSSITNSDTIDITNFLSGIYLISCETESGVTTQKFIKK